MSETETKTLFRAKALSVLALTLAVLSPGVMVWLWSRPIAAPPSELPPLLLDPLAVEAELREDEALASQEPDSEAAAARRRLYHESNEAERSASDTPATARERRRRLLAATHAVVREEGEDAIAAMRAADVARMEAALRGELAAGDAISEIGDFLETMERYQMARDRHQLAPRFVVRSVFKARWNAMHRREMTEGLGAEGERAYWGWLALSVESAPMEQRLLALERYGDAGGLRADEARAVMMFDTGDLEEAHAAFLAVLETRPTFRIRNHALASTPRDP